MSCPLKCLFLAVKHGCGTRGAALASDGVGCGDARGKPLPACPAASRSIMPRGFCFFLSRLAPTWLRLGPIHAESGLNQPESTVSAETADSGRNSRKKKRVQNAPFKLNIKPSFSSFHTNTPNLTLYLSLSSSLTRLSLSVCSLPLSLLAVRHSASAESVT